MRLAGGASQGHHGRVLDEHEQVPVELPLDAAGGERSLELERIAVGHAAQAEDGDLAAHASPARRAARWATIAARTSAPR